MAEEIKKVPLEVAAVVADSGSDDEKQSVVEVGHLSDGINREVEKRILRKFDLHIFPLLTFMYFCS